MGQKVRRRLAEVFDSFDVEDSDKLRVRLDAEKNLDVFRDVLSNKINLGKLMTRKGIISLNVSKFDACEERFIILC